MRFPAPIALPLLVAGLAAGSAARAATLNVPLNHSVKLAVAGHAASVVVGNSKVADVTVVDTRTLFVTGRSPGSTDVMVVDPLGRTVYAADIWVAAGAGKQITVHRAGVAAEVACDPRCLPVPGQGPAAVAAAAPPAGAGAGAAAPVAQLGAALGGSIGGAVGAAAASGAAAAMPAVIPIGYLSGSAPAPQ